MGCSTTNCDDEGKRENEEDEVYSLCNLPVKLIKEDSQIHQKNEEDGEESKATKTDEDFNFGSLCETLSTEPECVRLMKCSFKAKFYPSVSPLAQPAGSHGAGKIACQGPNPWTMKHLLSRYLQLHSHLNRLLPIDQVTIEQSSGALKITFRGKVSYLNILNVSLSYLLADIGSFSLDP
ncbi:hypothetical protein F3Y22_tig00110745pilonHSYRG00037 [Hibiscus syriacus]|uniref:Uncharacterized protein n=1 Tax=Hibiscus syriacus TaxID=106335 RepID=A0A6A2ZSZ1_HIBSY|nr:hypothetical protein F3Y22_tig00110745pilonHSYRG00037 [Hibiscus syriacus]